MSVGSKNALLPSKIPEPIPRCVMLKLGKKITPKTDVVTLTPEQFCVKHTTWTISSKVIVPKKRGQAGHSAFETNALKEFRMGSI